MESGDHDIKSQTASQVDISKMAASAEVMEESEVVASLSHSLGISKDVLAKIASQNEETASVFSKAKAVFEELASSKEKYRLDMANLRRARVNAGLCCFCFLCSVALAEFLCLKSNICRALLIRLLPTFSTSNVCVCSCVIAQVGVYTL